jgi:hypothetical protein
MGAAGSARRPESARRCLSFGQNVVRFLNRKQMEGCPAGPHEPRLILRGFHIGQEFNA